MSGIYFNVLNKYPTLGPVGGESLKMGSRISPPAGPSVGYLLRFSIHCPTLGSVSGESLETESRISLIGPSVGYFYGAPNKYPTLGPVNGESLET